jgi:membrane dipeptidase
MERLVGPKACGRIAASLALLATAGACAAPTPEERARHIHAGAPVIDGHNDLPWELREKWASSPSHGDLRERQPEFHTDLPRLREGGVGAQFWSAWVAFDPDRSTLETFLEQIDVIHRMVDFYSDDLEMAATADDVERIRGIGRVACLIGVEGGHAIDDSLAALRLFHRLGVRYMTLTHTETTSWADSSTDAPRHGGLSEFGEQVVNTMNWLGMLVDLSHVSDETAWDALRVTKAPVICSHSSARALADHPRNVPDDLLAAIGASGGVVMVNFFPGFVVPASAEILQRGLAHKRELLAAGVKGEALGTAMDEWRAAHPLARGTVQDVCDHIEHVAKVAGVDHVGIGSDFDGIPVTPAGLDDASTYPAITAELLRRGWSEQDLRKLLGENVLRVLREAERISIELTSSPAARRIGYVGG